MKKAILLLGVLSILAQPAHAVTTGHVVRKALWLPVFWVFAFPVSIITWWEVADEHKKLVVVNDDAPIGANE